MRFVLVTTGSSGDVKPFLALAVGLEKVGHQVRLAGPEDARAACERLGIEFYPIEASHQEALRASQASQRLQGGNTLRFGLQRMREKRVIFHEVNRAALVACQGAEAIAYRIGGFLAADSIAERMGVPCFKAGLVPYTPTGEYPSLRVFRGRGWGRVGNRFSYWISEQAIWQFFRGEINAFRQELGLKAAPLSGPAEFSRSLPVLYAFSPTLLPRPADWPESVQITGSWELEEGQDWQPPAGLVEFIENGPAPVYVGFGSMVSRNPRETYDLVKRAVQQCGQRAVLARGWEGMGVEEGLDGQIYLIDQAPHDWLFPRMKVIVHHGGVGTTTAALRAGKPAVIVPYNYDQPFWGWVAHRLGAGPRPIPRKRLSAERLAGAIEECLENADLQRRAAELGREMQAEDGVREAGLQINRIVHY
jgi:UDP:flavonoid glycosyltransferase YjiC (YdhE family)